MLPLVALFLARIFKRFGAQDSLQSGQASFGNCQRSFRFRELPPVSRGAVRFLAKLLTQAGQLMAPSGFDAAYPSGEGEPEPGQASVASARRRSAWR